MKTVSQLARDAAMRAIPMDGDGEAYRQRLADFQRGAIDAAMKPSSNSASESK